MKKDQIQFNPNQAENRMTCFICKRSGHDITKCPRITFRLDQMNVWGKYLHQLRHNQKRSNQQFLRRSKSQRHQTFKGIQKMRIALINCRKTFLALFDDEDDHQFSDYSLDYVSDMEFYLNNPQLIIENEQQMAIDDSNSSFINFCEDLQNIQGLRPHHGRDSLSQIGNNTLEMNFNNQNENANDQYVQLDFLNTQNNFNNIIKTIHNGNNKFNCTNNSNTINHDYNTEFQIEVEGGQQIPNNLNDNNMDNHLPSFNNFENITDKRLHLNVFRKNSNQNLNMIIINKRPPSVIKKRILKGIKIFSNTLKSYQSLIITKNMFRVVFRKYNKLSREILLIK